MESMTFASWKEWRGRGRERKEGACRGMFLVVLGLEDFLSQTEARYWPEIISHCCRKDENVLSGDRVKPKWGGTGIVPRLHLELPAFVWRDIEIGIKRFRHLEI